MAWSWLRRRADRGPVPAPTAAPVPAAPTVQREPEWPDVPPVQRTLARALAPVAPLDAFVGGLAAHQNPSFLGALGHQVDPAGPGGLVSGLAVPRPGRTESYAGTAALSVPAAAKPKPTVQRTAVRWSPDAEETPAPVPPAESAAEPAGTETESENGAGAAAAPTPAPAPPPVQRSVQRQITADPVRPVPLSPPRSSAPSLPTATSASVSVPVPAVQRRLAAVPEGRPRRSSPLPVEPLALPVVARQPADAAPPATPSPVSVTWSDVPSGPPAAVANGPDLTTPVLGQVEPTTVLSTPDPASAPGGPGSAESGSAVSGPQAAASDAAPVAYEPLPVSERSAERGAALVQRTVAAPTAEGSADAEPAADEPTPVAPIVGQRTLATPGPTPPGPSPQPPAATLAPLTPAPPAPGSFAGTPGRLARDPGSLVGTAMVPQVHPGTLPGAATPDAGSMSGPPPAGPSMPTSPPEPVGGAGPLVQRAAVEADRPRSPSVDAPLVGGTDLVESSDPITHRDAAEPGVPLEPADPVPLPELPPQAPAIHQVAPLHRPGPLPTTEPAVTTTPVVPLSGFAARIAGLADPRPAAPIQREITADPVVPADPTAALPTAALPAALPTAALVADRPVPTSLRTDLGSAVAPPRPADPVAFARTTPREPAPVSRMVEPIRLAFPPSAADGPTPPTRTEPLARSEPLTPLEPAARTDPYVRSEPLTPLEPASRPAPYAGSNGHHVQRSFAAMFAGAPPSPLPVPAPAPAAEHPGFTSVQLQTAEPAASVPPAPAPEPAPEAPSPAPVQTAPAPAPAPPAAGVPGAADLDEMARRLFEPLSARLRAELWLDRERAGLVTDVRH